MVDFPKSPTLTHPSIHPSTQPSTHSSIQPSRQPQVLLAAAHAGFGGMGLPLGGGAAVADRLAVEWSRTQPWPLTVLGAGPRPPCGGIGFEHVGAAGRTLNLTRLSEREYGRFCRSFAGAVTMRILSHNEEAALSPNVVVVNDIAEGPAFKLIAAAGISIFTIFHVDVVDYFCRIYLRGMVRPERATHFYDRLCRRGWEWMVPPLLRLVFGQQRDAVMHSTGLILPSSGMAAVLLRCYPDLPPERVHVIPWGCWSEDLSEAAVIAARQRILSHLPTLRTPTLLTLSRISPEKGLDTLVDALLLRERRGGTPVTLLVAGEAAYMRGRSFLQRVRKRAGRLGQSRVHFTGYADAAAKRALFRLADVYVFPSRHESYGLTLCEALAAGLPVITTDHYSAADQVTANTGWIVPREDAWALANAIDDACDAATLHRKRFAISKRPPPDFSEAAAVLGRLVSDAVNPP